MAMSKAVSLQTVTLLYGAPADSRRINLRFQKVRQVGIYEGMYLSDAGGGSLSLSKGVCEISDGTYQVRVATTGNTTGITPANGEFVVLRWTYTADRTDDILDVHTVVTPATNDVIVAEVIAANPMSLDYGDVDYPRTQPNTLDLFLKVEAPDVNDSNQMKPRVRAGRIQIPTGVVEIDDQSTPAAFTNPNGSGTEYGLVYIDEDGAIQVAQNDGNATAAAAYADISGQRVLAELEIPDPTTTITQSMIKDVRSFTSINLLDEDDMASNSAKQGATQQSLKAYIDSFHVYASMYASLPQTIVAGARTKITYNVAIADSTGSIVDLVNNRLTPDVAGWYVVTLMLGVENMGDNDQIHVIIRKNVGDVASGVYATNNISGQSDPVGVASALVYFNGSTDYVEAYIDYQAAVNKSTMPGLTRPFFLFKVG